MSLWPQPKNRIQANLALWLGGGQSEGESGRQIIWSSNPGLSTNFLCLCYLKEQSDTGMGESGGREWRGERQEGSEKGKMSWAVVKMRDEGQEERDKGGKTVAESKRSL